MFSEIFQFHVWHHRSSLMNHNHIMMMLAAIYDSEVYIKSDEYFQKTRTLCNEQATLEKAQVYFV